MHCTVNPQQRLSWVSERHLLECLHKAEQTRMRALQKALKRVQILLEMSMIKPAASDCLLA